MVGEDVSEPASAPDAAGDAAAAAIDPDEVLRYARALIAAPSENPGGTEDEVADVAMGILTDLGCRHPGRPIRGGASQRRRADRLRGAAAPRVERAPRHRAGRGALDVVERARSKARSSTAGWWAAEPAT